MKKKNAIDLSSVELSAFCSQVALILDAGMPLYDGMETLAENSADGEYAELYAAVSRGVNETGSLYQAIKDDERWPQYMVEMVSIGETTGHLQDVMEGLADYYEREGRIRESIVSAVTYPLVLGAMLLVIVMVLIIKVLPIFGRVLNSMGVSVSADGTSLMRVGEVIGLAVMAAVGLVLLAVIVFVVLLQTGMREKALGLLRKIFPPIGKISRRLSAARVAGVLSMMLSGGFPMEDALRMAPNVLADEASKAKVLEMKDKVDQGDSFGTVITESGLFDSLHSRMIRMGVAAGREDVMMKKVADIYEEEVENRIAHLVSIIEPTLVALLAIVIGAVLLTVMLPMTGILSGIL